MTLFYVLFGIGFLLMAAAFVLNLREDTSYAIPIAVALSAAFTIAALVPLALVA